MSREKSKTSLTASLNALLLAAAAISAAPMVIAQSEPDPAQVPQDVTEGSESSSSEGSTNEESAPPANPCAPKPKKKPKNPCG